MNGSSRTQPYVSEIGCISNGLFRHTAAYHCFKQGAMQRMPRSPQTVSNVVPICTAVTAVSYREFGCMPHYCLFMSVTEYTQSVSMLVQIYVLIFEHGHCFSSLRLLQLNGLRIDCFLLFKSISPRQTAFLASEMDVNSGYSNLLYTVYFSEGLNLLYQLSE